jgi:hypothetical protein
MTASPLTPGASSDAKAKHVSEEIAATHSRSIIDSAGCKYQYWHCCLLLDLSHLVIQYYSNLCYGI